jgi:DNA-binding transcriptional ArsR family regulator
MTETHVTCDVATSAVFDCLAIINLWQSSMLVDAGFAELNDRLNQSICANEHPIIAKFSMHDVNTLQLCEFLVQGGELQDVHRFCRTLRDIPLLAYLEQLFDGEYSAQELQRILRNEIDEPLERLGGVINPFEWGSDLVLMHEPLTRLIESVYELSRPYLQSLQPGLVDYQKGLRKHLKNMPPIEVSQLELAKRFIRVSDYQNYQFVVSPFVVRAIRFFNDTSLITFTGPNKQPVVRTKEEAVTLFKVLADDTRLAILSLLAKEKLYGKQIADRLGKTTATISHHLDSLHSAGLIRQEKLQQTKFYSYHPKALEQQLDSISELLKK